MKTMQEQKEELGLMVDLSEPRTRYYRPEVSVGVAVGEAKLCDVHVRLAGEHRWGRAGGPSQAQGRIVGQRAGVLPAGSASARGTLAVSESCGETSPVPRLSQALGASPMDAQPLKEAEGETSEGPGALQVLGLSLTSTSSASPSLAPRGSRVSFLGLGPAHGQWRWCWAVMVMPVTGR